MWRSHADEDPIEGWEPTPFDPDTRNVAHWAFRGLVLLLIAGMAAGAAWYITGWREANRRAAVDAVVASATRLQSTVDDVAAAIADLPDPSLAAPDVSALADFDVAARDLFETASALDPNHPRTGPLRMKAIETAQQALEIETVLGDAVAYAAAFRLLVEPPDLPSRVAESAIPETAATTAEWVIGFADGAAGLPTIPLLDQHRSLVEEVAGRLPAWQESYLDAIRRGDEQAALTQLAQVRTWLDELESSWSSAAQEVGRWTEEAIRVLEARLGEITPEA